MHEDKLVVEYMQNAKVNQPLFNPQIKVSLTKKYDYVLECSSSAWLKKWWANQNAEVGNGEDQIIGW